ncbi:MULTISPECIES: BREX system ATP-binding protein BrxD [unclassified Actinopolyspora]|uniref:BREX system ATP-binding protein BrxD n=1 Tax=unclassified Actinopolyspora TaxID=2639451 RepID=UPI0013F606F8|nr:MULTISPECIES: BREX system ATP-binding protein BrxD [unclassified Actinopolyspora]NHD18837.1 BREX system ATP-binding protein BrxD [Actinopolyspora sp. BKK2]NHE77260.1 BREX system ATP-binding protein BrxD [Actinopolyspora sp. BKK1]
MNQVSPARRRDVIAALRRGTVPEDGLDLFAVGLDRLHGTFDEELDGCASGRANFKAVRGEYGAGKTFLARWLAERAKNKNMAVAEVQISETETPLHKLETVYRRLCEQLATPTEGPSAFRSVLDSWLYTLEEDAIGADESLADDADRLAEAVSELLEKRLAKLGSSATGYSAALRGYYKAENNQDTEGADGLAAWLSGQRHVASELRKRAGIKGDLDHFLALSFLEALLLVLRDAGHPGLLLVLDEVETLQRVRSDARAKALNALRQLIDEVDSGRFPGLYLLVTGTPAFYEGRQGVQLLPPLAQRLSTDFSGKPEFDNPRAPQIRLHGFTHERLVELGGNVRDLFSEGLSTADGTAQRVAEKVDDAYLRDFATAIAGQLGGKVGVAPRVFLRKLVDVLDKVEQHPNFDPRHDHEVSVSDTELTTAEQAARATGAETADDVELDL